MLATGEEIEFAEIPDRYDWLEDSSKLYLDRDYRFSDGTYVSTYLVCNDDSEIILCDGGSSLEYLERTLGRSLKSYMDHVQPVFKPLEINELHMVYIAARKAMINANLADPFVLKRYLRYFTRTCISRASHFIICPVFRRILNAN